jgi:hypothetical protein
MDESREPLMARRGDGSFPPLQRLSRNATEQPTEADHVRARAVELLESMDEIQIPIGRKQRLLFRLGQGHPSRARRLRWLRPVVIGAFLMGIGGGAIASVSLTKWPTWIVQSYRKLVSGAADPPLPVAATPPARRLAVKAPAVAPEPSEPSPPSRVWGKPQVSQRADARPRRPPVESPSDDAALLVEATRALHVGRDPGRARGLARRYLERQPSGPLADEALAISIEAALDHHDPDAAALSARYLAQFPHGPFRGLAERTLASPQ